MKTHIWLFCGLLAAVFTFSLPMTGCNSNNSAADADAETVRVVLDWTPNTNHTGLYVAQQLGYYTDAGLNVEIIQPPEDGALALVGAGKADIGVDFQETIGSALTADAPLPVTAVAALINHNTSGIISLTKNSIQSPADLEGKRFAAWGTPLNNTIMRTVVEDDGGNIDKVTMLPNAVTDVVSALQSDIDAIWVYEGWDGVALQLSGLDGSYMAFGELNPVFDFYTPVLAANNTWLTENPGTVKAFLSATAKGYEYAISDPDAAAAILLEQVPELDSELVTASQRFLAEEYIADAPYWGYIDASRWAAFYDWMHEESLLPQALGNSGFTNTYLPGAQDGE